jgi:HAD superfamily hydrolase (TIGR01509 family)
MDGTIVDSMKFHDEAWLIYINSKGVKITKEELDTAHFGTLTQMIKRIFGNHLSDEQAVKMGYEKEEIFREIYRPHIQPIEGLIDYFEKIKSAGCKIALATMGEWPNVNFTLDSINVRHYFDAIITGGDVVNGKPHPEIFNKAINAIGSSPEHSIIFEDSKSGIKGAIESQAKVIGIATMFDKEYLLNLGVKKVLDNYTNAIEEI